MKVATCWQMTSLSVLLLLAVRTKAFVVVSPRYHTMTKQLFAADKTEVEVCGSKDCKRGGGGPRLEKAIGEILQEKDLTESFSVEGCECQGECGYGPNLLVDGKIINNVRGRDAVLQALGIDQES